MTGGTVCGKSARTGLWGSRWATTGSTRRFARSVPQVPEHFRGWVNPGGRLFVVTGDAPAMEAMLHTRLNATEWREESLFETDLPRLVNAEQAPQFEF